MLRTKLHVMFLPYMAPGHMMPMVDIARLFAAHDVKVTIITTPKNAARFNNTIDCDINSGRDISIHILQFPSVEAGLPEGCENLTSAPTPEMSIKLFHAVEMLQPKIEKLVRDHRPNCIASDVMFHWTACLANELGIPRLAFSGSGFFNLCVADSMERNEPHKNIESETKSFVIPGLPNQVEITRSQLPDIVKTKTEFSKLFEILKEAERQSFGMLVNSFHDLEPGYGDHFKNVTGYKAWELGPISLYYKNAEDKNGRGNDGSMEKHNYKTWLDSKELNSVVYVCFGSLARFNKPQITEIANALEDSGHSFIWVVGKYLKKTEEEINDDQQWWLPEGFEERMERNKRGLVIKGWAPQVMILEHLAIGAFLTHCGWNSVLEGVSAGVPLVTWPMFADQFYNEKLVIQVQKVGVSVGNEMWKIWATQESELIGRDKIRKAVDRVMKNGKESEEMRKKAKWLSEMARKAVSEGGSSNNNVKLLIEEIRCYGRK